MTTRPGDRQATYQDLRERIKRHERGREESLKRLVESHRERHLHSFQSQAETLDTEALD